MFPYSVFLVETTAFYYRQDTDKPQTELISYINYIFSHWQTCSCLIEPGGQKLDADGGQNLGFGFGLVSSNNYGFGFDLKTDPALKVMLMFSVNLRAASAATWDQQSTRNSRQWNALRAQRPVAGCWRCCRQQRDISDTLSRCHSTAASVTECHTRRCWYPLRPFTSVKFNNSQSTSLKTTISTTNNAQWLQHHNQCMMALI